MINVTPDLTASDPDVRRAAIHALGRSAYPAVLPALEQAAEHDPLPELRELAAEAIVFVRGVQAHEQRMEQLIEAHLHPQALPNQAAEQRPSIHAPTLTKIYSNGASTLNGKHPTKRLPYPVRLLSRRLLAWMIVLGTLALMGVGWNWFVNSGMYDRYMTALGFEYTTYDVTTRRLSDGTTFRLLIPPGEAPADGYPVLVAVHGAGGDGRAMMALFAERCRRAGVILIAPTFPNEAGMNYYMYRPNDQRLNIILDTVWEDHHFDPRGVVLMGYSSGAVFATWFASEYGADLAGVALIGLPASEPLPPMPARRELEFWLSAGAEDQIAIAASQAYTDRLYANGSPVYWEAVPHGGFDLHPEQVNLVMDLIETVYSR